MRRTLHRAIVTRTSNPARLRFRLAHLSTTSLLARIFPSPHPSRCERAQESLKSLDIDRIVTFSDYRVSIGPRYSIMVLVSFLVFDVGLSLSAAIGSV